MKTTTTVTIPPSKPKTVTLTVCTCDVPGCGAKVLPYKYSWGKMGHKCCICDRDICAKHIVNDYYHSDDYPDHLCPLCAELYLEARKQLHIKHDLEEEQLIKSTKEKSLNVKN